MFESMMKWAVGLLTVGCVLALVGPAAAEFTPKNSADFDWCYEMDAEPSATDLDGVGGYDFTTIGTGGSGSASDGILTMTGGGNGYFCYENIDETQPWNLDTTITYGSGYTFEVSIRIEAANPWGFAFDAIPDPGSPGAWLNVVADGQLWGDMASTPLPGDGTVDNTDAFHVFRVAQAEGATTYSVWRDGVLLSESLGAGTTGGANEIIFGDFGSEWGGVCHIDYFRFTSGAWAPDDTPPIPGDANNDKIVDDKDASILAANWQYGPDATWGHGDFNDDGIVNDEDASILAAHWLETQEGSTAPVPEPASSVLLAGALLALALWRKTRG